MLIGAVDPVCCFVSLVHRCTGGHFSGSPQVLLFKGTSGVNEPISLFFLMFPSAVARNESDRTWSSVLRKKNTLIIRLLFGLLAQGLLATAATTNTDEGKGT